ncbi:MAG: thermonuclease family protein [Alphaproteobacteria bacterium]|nr:thermonuclease family protein [Alphaproteobacteria bacterium]
MVVPLIIIMAKFLILLLFAVFSLSPSASHASSLPVIERVISADTLELNDKTIVRLAGIKAPEQQALANEAKAYAEKISLGKSIELNKAGTDRHGRILAQVYITEANGKKIWLQEYLAQAGAAYVFPTKEAENFTPALLKSETSARSTKTGIWKDASYADIPAENAAPAQGHYAFVTGRAVDCAKRKDKTYINFGEDWKTDFTITIAESARRLMRKNKQDPMDLRGRKIRVRGLIENLNGPMITISRPEQIEPIK